MSNTSNQRDHLISVYLNRRMPKIEKAEGIYLHDDQGNRIIDASGGAVVCSIGHGVAEIAEAAAKQMP